MDRLMQLVRQGHHAMEQVPFSARRITHALAENRPSQRLLAADGFVEARNLGFNPAINAFWERFENVQVALGGRYVARRRSEWVIAQALISYPIATFVAVSAFICTGVNACIAAAHLKRSGRHDEARERLRQNAFEVFWTLRLSEEACFIAAAVVGFRMIRHAYYKGQKF